MRDRAKAERMLGTNAQIIEADLADRAGMGSLVLSCDYIVHCACATASANMISRPVERT